MLQQAALTAAHHGAASPSRFWVDCGGSGAGITSPVTRPVNTFPLLKDSGQELTVLPATRSCSKDTSGVTLGEDGQHVLQ